MKLSDYLLSLTKNIFLSIIRKIVGRDNFKRSKYYGKKIESMDVANDEISNAILASSPFLAARFGDVELRALVYTIEYKLGIRKKFPDYIKNRLHLNAGFFPATDENIVKFGEVLWESSKNVDLFGVWYNHLEDYVIKKTNENATLVELESLEPYRSDNPWSFALKNKKVLVVHPFEESIIAQYQKREKLFGNADVLPEFELIVYKAIQTNAGGSCEFSTWFEALDFMFEEIKKLDFDIAIVGCGAYGMVLSSKIKNLGKTVIHLGGATQILFGICGTRWDNKPAVKSLYNEYWVRPLESEKPNQADNVEGGCYW